MRFVPAPAGAFGWRGGVGVLTVCSPDEVCKILQHVLSIPLRVLIHVLR